MFPVSGALRCVAFLPRSLRPSKLWRGIPIDPMSVPIRATTHRVTAGFGQSSHVGYQSSTYYIILSLQHNFIIITSLVLHHLSYLHA